MSVVQVKSSPSEASMGKAFTLVHVQHVTHRSKHNRSAPFPHTCSSLNQKTNTRSYLYKKENYYFYFYLHGFFLFIFHCFAEVKELVWRSEIGACTDYSKEAAYEFMWQFVIWCFFSHLICKHKKTTHILGDQNI